MILSQLVVLDLDAFENLKDEELIHLYRGGENRAEEALIVRYTPYVRSFTRPYFLAGGDNEDLIQEGMIGVVKAISEFDEARCASFRTFVALCIRSRIYSAIRHTMREKRIPSGNCISVGSAEDSEINLESIVAFSDASLDPVEQIIGEESYRELLQAVSELLSKFEKRVLDLYLEGLSYDEISKRVSKPQKSVDNAVQRIRRKFAQYLTSRGDIR